MDDNEKKQEITEKNLGLVGKLEQLMSQNQSEGNNSSTKVKK